LQRNGNILAEGRNEKEIIQNKREAEQQSMKAAL
jgi:hypothetical protein